MDNVTKQQISDQLRKYVENMAGGSANKASKMLNGISNAYISLMLNNKWESISDEGWRNLQKQLFASNNGWRAVNTKASTLLIRLFDDAKSNANTFGIIGDAGCGKTFTALKYAEGENVFLVCCNEYYNRKTFLGELLQTMGKDGGGFTVAEMMQAVIQTIRKIENPIIILDEADKLSDQVLYFFISLYNLLNGKCGLVLMATDHLEKRIEKGVRTNRKGYKEIFSRLGRKFISLPKPSKKDVSEVVRANGIADELTITEIFNSSEYDLRRVERLVHSKKKLEVA